MYGFIYVNWFLSNVQHPELLTRPFSKFPKISETFQEYEYIYIYTLYRVSYIYAFMNIHMQYMLMYVYPYHIETNTNIPPALPQLNMEKKTKRHGVGRSPCAFLA